MMPRKKLKNKKLKAKVNNGVVNFLLILLPVISCIDFTWAQEIPSKKDSTELYKDIESYSKRSKFNSLIYKLIFKPVPPAATKKKSKKKQYDKLIQKSYRAFEGKIIRHIHITTLDPFGYSVSDTTASEQTKVLRSLNKIHVKTQRITILNLLLIRENQPFDSLLVKESERLIRKNNYVHDVLFRIEATSKNSDSVDIFIREQDNWSLIPGISASPSRFVFALTENNFIGTGHKSENKFAWYHTTGESSYNINYYIPNIRNTYVSSRLNYSIDEFENVIKVVSVDRPFFSPFAKWAAGVNFTQQQRNNTIDQRDPLFVKNFYKQNSQDYWAGNSFQIFKGYTEDDRTTNFISSIRYYRVRYPVKPNEESDSLHAFANENMYLSSIGISRRKYVQDKFIFGFGLTEDVPIGNVYSLTGGNLDKNNIGRVYIGARVSYGNYYSWGYLSTSYEYGTYFRSSHAEQGLLSIDVTYFTGLWELGKWRFREFIKPAITIGIDKISSNGLSLDDNYGLYGFNSLELRGDDRLLLNFQTQTYSPWNLIGFHFGPFLSYSLGLLSDNQNGFKRSRVYSQVSIGVLIRNDNLVFNTFQLSVSFYPIIPGTGQNIIKVNSFKTNNFKLNDFDIGKPTLAAFQ